MADATTLTYEMLQKARASLLAPGIESLNPDITVSPADEYGVRKTLQPNNPSIFLWPSIRVWVDKRLPTGQWHWGKPQEPIEDAW